MKKLFVCFLIVLFFGCLFESKDTTGTVDDTHTGVAMILNPDSTPAAEAIIKIFAVNDTSRIPEKQTATDSEGRFSFKGLAKGSYNVMAEKEELAAFQDSVVVSEDTVFFEQDILGDPKTVSGFVGLQPHHDPRTVTVQALGTDKHSNVDKDGMFTLSDMAVGEYTLRLVTTLPDYTPTFAPLVIDPSSPDTLADTLELLYTGIPVVKGLSAGYDTLAGVVTLTWDAADFSNFQEYLVFRQLDTSLGVDETPLGATEDTVYTDIVFPGDMDSEVHYADTNSYDFEYRVKIKDATDKIGENFGFVSVRAVSPAKVRTTAEFEVLDLEYQESLDSNEFIKVAVHLKNPTRAAATQIQWFDREADSLLREVSFDPEENRVSDTLVFPFEYNFAKQLGISFIDGNGLEWDYSLDLNAPELPVIDSANSVKAYEIFEVPPAVQGTDWRYSAVNLPDWISLDSLTGRLHGNPENSDTGSYEDITLLATDGKLASRSSSFSIEVLKNPWVPVDSLIGPKALATCNVVNDMVYVVGGFSEEVERYDPVMNKWSQRASMPNVGKSNHTSSVVSGKIYVVGGLENDGIDGPDSSIYEYDPIEDAWTTKKHQFYVLNPSATVYEDKIYVFGGVTGGEYDPVAVSLAYDPVLNVMDTLAPMPMPRYRHASILWEEKIYVIGGEGSTEMPISSIIMYDPELDSWESSGWPDYPLDSYNSKVVVSGGRIYVFAATGGDGDVAFTYDPAIGGDWVAVRGGPLSYGSVGQELGKEVQAYCGLGETILAVGGVDIDGNASSSVYRYYPALDE